MYSFWAATNKCEPLENLLKTFLKAKWRWSLDPTRQEVKGADVLDLDLAKYLLEIEFQTKHKNARLIIRL